MTMNTMKMAGNTAFPNDLDNSNSLPLAIPLGHAIEPEPTIVIYDNNCVREDSRLFTTAATAILVAAPTTGTGISTSTVSFTTTPRISCFAITSLVLGIVSIVFIIVGMLLGFLAIIFGVLAVHRIRNQPNEYRGISFAYSGIITGTIGMIFWISVFAAIALRNDGPDMHH
jgi:Domain of unknown function (DUF4190)